MLTGAAAHRVHITQERRKRWSQPPSQRERERYGDKDKDNGRKVCKESARVKTKAEWE